MAFRSQLFTAKKEARDVDDAQLNGPRALKFVKAFEDNTAGWFWETDSENRLVYLSPSLRHRLERNGSDVLGQPLASVLQLDPDAHDVARSFNFYLSSRMSLREYPVVPCSDADGQAWSLSGHPQYDKAGSFIGYVGSGQDVSERRRSQAAITKLAFSDPLTGLANRQRMKNVLERLLVSRTSGFNPTALLMLDLDRFKVVNDTLGHQTGDALLVQVAQRLKQVVGSGGIVGRQGGDEFQILIAQDDIRENVGEIAGAIITSVSQPYFLGGAPIVVGCSVGIAILPEHGKCADELTRSADLALYAAKDGGRGTYRLYNDKLLDQATTRKELENDLRNALSKGEFHLVYQRVVNTATQKLTGFEALLRWNHPERGPVSPVDFIPLAEECGLIEQLGEWVLRTAVKEATRWPDHLRVAVNVSPVQFANPNLPTVVANALAATGLLPSRLELELTESVFVSQEPGTDERFKMLKKVGVRLALDDFGTGYSSIGYLKTAPFDKIKIDQSFVRGAIQPGNRNVAIITAIVTLANALNMETTAEGVEHQDEISLIRELGCTHIQGFVYGLPVTADSLNVTFLDEAAIVQPSGRQVTRELRYKTLRNTTIKIGDKRHTAQVRNLSNHGAMISGVDLSKLSIGDEISLELEEGEFILAQLQWVHELKAGVYFANGLALRV